MKLLLVTQKVDIDDPILGFFHRWIEEFAKQCEKVTVICLFEGKHNLPENVKVLSLGKESGASHLTYILRFYKYILHELKNYDSVFVHMNQVYVLLGWKIWRFFGKKIILWYNHRKGTLSTRFAVLFSNSVMYTSGFAFTARYKKASKMPVGIDTNFFKPSTTIQKEPHSLLFLGRLSAVKDVDVFIKALYILHKRGIEFSANIYGNAEQEDENHEKKLRNMATGLERDKKLVFHNGVTNSETPRIYNEHEIYINATGQGSFDKTIIEAMASGTMVIACNKSLHDVLDDHLFKEGDSCDLAGKLESILQLSDDKKMALQKAYRDHAVEGHDLKKLVQEIANNYKSHD